MKMLKNVGENSMYHVFEKRSRWNVHLDGKLVAKFATEKEAKEFAGLDTPAKETSSGSKEEEKKVSKKEANTDKQKLAYFSCFHDVP